MKLYKYSPPDVFTKMFRRKGFVGLKCDLPKNYNDPFELFLSLDANVEDIAYYMEILGEIPQMPTSCFSKRPDKRLRSTSGSIKSVDLVKFILWKNVYRRHLSVKTEAGSDCGRIAAHPKNCSSLAISYCSFHSFEVMSYGPP
jgi:hypothetical protein